MEMCMRRLILATTLFMVVACTSTKPVLVTKEQIAKLPAGTPYVIDITRRRAVYDVADGIDYSRVEVRASDGERPFKEFIGRRTPVAPARTLMANNLADLIDLLPPENDGVSEASCSGGSCQCNGRRDCSDLSKSGKCESGANDAVCGSGYGGKIDRWGCFCRQRQ